MSTKSMIFDKDVCTVEDANDQRYLLYFLTIGMAFVNMLLFGAVAIRRILFPVLKFVLPGVQGDFGIEDAWIAGVFEPFVTKLLFGVLAYLGFLLILKASNDERCLDFKRDSLWLGLSGGLAAGIAEIYTKIDPVTTLPWMSSGFDPLMLAPILVHVINGGLVVGTFFLVVNDKTMSGVDWAKLGLAISLAMFIHTVWIVWLARQDWFIESLRVILS